MNNIIWVYLRVNINTNINLNSLSSNLRPFLTSTIVNGKSKKTISPLRDEQYYNDAAHIALLLIKYYTINP